MPRTTPRLITVAAVFLFLGCDPVGEEPSSGSSRHDEIRSDPHGSSDTRRDKASKRDEDRGKRQGDDDRRRKSSKRKLPPPPDVDAPPSDALKTESGIASKVLVKGSGSDHPGRNDKVKVHYTGWTTDGEMFDSSVVKGKAAVFPLSRVIPGWTEGVQLMVKGEKRLFWIPEELAYKGRPNRPQGMLVFDIELIDIVR